PPQLDVRDPEPRVALDGQAQHRQPVRRRRDRALALPPRLAGRDVEHLVERERVERLLPQDQVPQVHGVERPAEDPDLHGPLRRPLTTPPTAARCPRTARGHPAARPRASAPPPRPSGPAAASSPRATRPTAAPTSR